MIDPATGDWLQVAASAAFATGRGAVGEGFGEFVSAGKVERAGEGETLVGDKFAHPLREGHQARAGEMNG